MFKKALEVNVEQNRSRGRQKLHWTVVDGDTSVRARIGMLEYRMLPISIKPLDIDLGIAVVLILKEVNSNSGQSDDSQTIIELFSFF